MKQEVWENAKPAQNGARYSIKNVGGKDIVSIDTDQNVFDGVERKDYGKVAREYIKSHFRGNSVNDVGFTKYSEKEYTRSKGTQRLYDSASPVYDTKMKASTELDNFVRTGEFIRHEKANHPHSYNEGGYDRYAVEFELGGESFKGEMLVAKNSANKAMFYDIVNIKEKNTLRYPDAPLKGSEGGKNVLSTNSIRENGENVNSFSQKKAKTNSQSIGNLADVSYSASLKGRESTLKYQPAASTQGTENARAALRNIELLSGGRVDVVITADDILTADGQQVNGEYADGVIYVSAKADSYERAMFVISHEMVHTLEGTKQYGRLGAFIREQIKGNTDFAKQYDLDKYRSAYANAQAGEFSAETLDYQAETEMYADFVAREILGNEDVVRSLAAKEGNIATRFLEWARSALRRLGGNRADSAEYKTLKKAEKLLSAAIENAKGGVTLEDVEKDVQRMKALRDGAEVKEEVKSSENETQEVKKETTEENSVDVDAQSARYLIKQFNADKYDYNKSIKTVANMKSVADLKGDEFDLSKGGLINKVSIYYDSIGNNAYNEELGDIELTKRGIKDSFAHGIGEKKASAYHAVPKIIEKGRVVDYQKNWKKRGYDTAVIAAPITVANEEYYAVVVVRRTQANQRFYLHEIDIKKRQAVLTEATTTNSSTQELGGLPINSIFEKLRNVNTSDEKTLKKSSRKSLEVEQSTKEKRDSGYVSSLRNYLHRLNLSDELKADIIKKYGEKTAKRLFNVWENTTNRTDGVDIVTAHDRLWREGFRTYSTYEEDFLMDMDVTLRGRALKLYEKAAKGKDIALEDVKDILPVAKRERKTYHIYAITNYNEKGAVGLLKNNPSRPVGNAIKDGSFDNSIRDNSENVNSSDEKTLKKSSRKSLDVEQSAKEKRDSGYVSSLRNYLHRLNLSEELKADVIQKCR